MRIAFVYCFFYIHCSYVNDFGFFAMYTASSISAKHVRILCLKSNRERGEIKEREKNRKDGNKRIEMNKNREYKFSISGPGNNASFFRPRSNLKPCLPLNGDWSYSLPVPIAYVYCVFCVSKFTVHWPLELLDFAMRYAL